MLYVELAEKGAENAEVPVRVITWAPPSSLQRLNNGEKPQM
jgi:hypothetical protein